MFFFKNFQLSKHFSQLIENSSNKWHNYCIVTIQKEYNQNEFALARLFISASYINFINILTGRKLFLCTTLSN